MTTPRKVIGKAVALKRGHYFDPAGGYITVADGEVFPLLEGLEKARWFKRVEPNAPPAPPASAPEPVGQGKRQSRRPPPIDDDIA